MKSIKTILTIVTNIVLAILSIAVVVFLGGLVLLNSSSLQTQLMDYLTSISGVVYSTTTDTPVWVLNLNLVTTLILSIVAIFVLVNYKEQIKSFEWKGFGDKATTTFMRQTALAMFAVSMTNFQFMTDGSFYSLEWGGTFELSIWLFFISIILDVLRDKGYRLVKEK